MKFDLIKKRVLEKTDISFSNVSSVEITGVTSDSKNIASGNIFVCLKGARFDGHDFAAEAIERGAAMVAAERPLDESIPHIVVPDTRKALPILLSAFYSEPEKSFKHMIGITGTNGKTSTSYMLKRIFEEAGYKTGLIGTMRYLIGDEEYKVDESKAFLTTPDPELLFTLFNEMRSGGVEILIMEVSSHSLQLDKLYGVDFDSGIFTNLTRDHLDFHKTFDAYRDAKAKLFNKCSHGYFNSDDEATKRIMETATCTKVTYGIDSDADIKPFDILLNGAEGIEYSIMYKGERMDISLPIPGRFTVYNSLSAISCALGFGIGKDIICRALSSMSPVGGRIEKVDIDTDFSVFIDFAHTPDALENVLNTVRGFAKGRIITLFGCGGDRDRTKRPIMADVAARLSDKVIVTSDNSRTEDKQRIIDDILQGFDKDYKGYTVIVDRTSAIKHAMDIAQKDDVIILAGKGHEEYEIDITGKHPYSEKNIVIEHSKNF